MWIEPLHGFKTGIFGDAPPVAAVPHPWVLGSALTDGVQGAPPPQLVVSSSPHRRSLVP